MTQLYVKYNPYRLESVIKINGKLISEDSTLYGMVKGKRLQEWIGTFPEKLVEETHSVEYDIEFHGMALDWDDFEDSFHRAKEKGLIRHLNMRFTERKTDNDIKGKIVKIFNDLKSGPVDDFKDPKLIKAFDNVNHSVFPINVIATMSSGKSTLINALLGNRLMPAKNEACTATITEILDNDAELFKAAAYDENDNVLQCFDSINYETMTQLNDNKAVYKISVEGNIPFIDANDTALMLVDTPGPNNSQNQAHKNTTYRAINNDSNNMILYVLNLTQLSTNDDNALLSYVAEQIRKGGKRIRDRFLFVVNKVDSIKPEEESIEDVIHSTRNYLKNHGIEDPQLFFCSAFAALYIRTSLKGIDVGKLTIEQLFELPSSESDAITMIKKLNKNESMHLEKYATLSPTAQSQIDYKLSMAIQNGDIKEQALIHSGIYSIEAAITAYVKKYAKTKKVKDLIETFDEVLESTQVLAKAKKQVAIDAEAARACRERAKAVQAKIADGEEAEAFKEKIAKLDPITPIKRKAEELNRWSDEKVSSVFQHYGDVITSKSEAKHLVEHFSTLSSDVIAEMSAELESKINGELVEAGNKLLTEYQAKLTRFDESAEGGKLDFSTVDLIKGVLNNMKETAESWESDNFATDTVEDLGETYEEYRTYYEKVGQEAEEVAVGTKKVKTGTRKVQVGSHQEWAGTCKVANPKKKGFFGKLKFWEKDYIEKDVYETVKDYKDEDVYETVIEYQTVMRDIFEQRTETIEKYSVKTSMLQTALISQFRLMIGEGITNALDYAKNQSDAMKKQFSQSFDKLDNLIFQKYQELNRYEADEKAKTKALKDNQEILEWIQKNQQEIEAIIDI